MNEDIKKPILFKVVREEDQITFRQYMKYSASQLDIREKDLENWISEHPELLFGGEGILVISQSVSGKSMADILALDADGNLIIVEIKRDWSDRATVGQLLEYAANMTEVGQDKLEELHKTYWKSRCEGSDYNSLLSRFRKLNDDPQAGIPKPETMQHRIYIVAPVSDEGLNRIVKWLKKYKVPINFIPFTLYTVTDDTDMEILLEIGQLPKEQLVAEPNKYIWEGDWFFNTNETNFPGAYKKMFEQNVIAIHGYENGPTNLEGSNKGERVFAYVNRRGILAVGHVVDGEVIPGDTIFDGKREFHLKVEWEITVADKRGVTKSQVFDEKDYNLPVRSVFCGMNHHDAANWIVEQLRYGES